MRSFIDLKRKMLEIENLNYTKLTVINILRKACQMLKKRVKWQEISVTTIILDNNHRSCRISKRTECSIGGTLNIRAESRMLANSQSARARGRLQKIPHLLVIYLQVTETEFSQRYAPTIVFD